MPIEIAIPPSKSHTHRALLFAMLANGVSTIYNPLRSPDTDTMIAAIAKFGAHVEEGENFLRVTGSFAPQGGVVQAGNSGIVH